MTVNKAPIKTIIFDLDGVVVKRMDGLGNLLASILPYSPRVIDEQYFGPEFLDLMLGRIFEEEYWRLVSRRHGWNLPPEVPMRLARNTFGEIEGVRPQIVDLRRRGYKLGLLSNHVREWIVELERRLNYEQLFDDLVYSCHLGMLKPETAIYATALRRLRADPETTLFIDDRARNLLPARELGLRVLQFITPTQLASDLATVLGD